MNLKNVVTNTIMVVNTWEKKILDKFPIRTILAICFIVVLYQLYEIQSAISLVEGHVSSMEYEVSSIKSDVSSIESDVSSIKRSVR